MVGVMLHRGAALKAVDDPPPSIFSLVVVRRLIDRADLRGRALDGERQAIKLGGIPALNMNDSGVDHVDEYLLRTAI